MQRRLLFAGSLALAFATGMAAHDFVIAQQQVSARTVLETDMKGAMGDEALMQVYAFPPGAQLPWHIHPDAQELSYILDGALTLEIEGQGSRVLKAGDGAYVPANAVHRGLADATAGAKLVVMRIKPKGKPVMELVQR